MRCVACFEVDWILYVMGAGENLCFKLRWHFIYAFEVDATLIMWGKILLL